MIKEKITSLISVLPVADMQRSLEFYTKLFGAPDLEPMEGVAEYQFGSQAWIQLSLEENPKPGAVILGVEDVQATKQAIDSLGISNPEIMDYEGFLVLEVQDPDGNRLAFVQEPQA